MGEMAFRMSRCFVPAAFIQESAGINPDAVLRADLAPGGEADGTKNCPIMSVRLYRVAVWTSRLPFSRPGSTCHLPNCCRQPF